MILFVTNRFFYITQAINILSCNKSKIIQPRNERSNQSTQPAPILLPRGGNTVNHSVLLFPAFTCSPLLCLSLRHTMLFVYIKWDFTLDFRGWGRNSKAEESLPRKGQGPAPLSSPPTLRHCQGRDTCHPSL